MKPGGIVTVGLQRCDHAGEGAGIASGILVRWSPSRARIRSASCSCSGTSSSRRCSGGKRSRRAWSRSCRTGPIRDFQFSKASGLIRTITRRAGVWPATWFTRRSRSNACAIAPKPARWLGHLLWPPTRLRQRCGSIRGPHLSGARLPGWIVHARPGFGTAARLVLRSVFQCAPGFCGRSRAGIRPAGRSAGFATGRFRQRRGIRARPQELVGPVNQESVRLFRKGPLEDLKITV